MKVCTSKRFCSAILAMIMVLTMLPMSVVRAAESDAQTSYTLDATADLKAMDAGSKADGDMEPAGTDNYFTILYSEKTKIDGSEKTFDDGYTATQRLNFGGSSSTEPQKNMVKFTTSGAASVKLWWVSGGDGRFFSLLNSSYDTVDSTASTVESVKNSLYISNLAVEEAGTYYLAVPSGSNYLFKMEVTDGGTLAPVVREEWANVAAPVITEAAQDGDNIQVTVSAPIGQNGGDKLAVTMYDAQGEEIASKNSLAEVSEHTLTFTPTASGTYRFTAILSRDDEEEVKTAQSPDPVSFLLPLETPYIYSATSVGGGSVQVVFQGVPEAEYYEIYSSSNGDETFEGETEELEYTITGLEIGTLYQVTVVAVRGTDKSAPSNAASVTVTEEEQAIWGFTAYGTSTNTENNGYISNEDGTITVYSENGKGKIVPASTDGVAFYYTPIPTTQNFTLKATLTVDSWTYSNAQEGFGLMATDRLGTHGNSNNFWNNSYLAAATKNEYTSDAGAKYSMKLGVVSIARTGITAENLPLFEVNDSDTVANYFSSKSSTLEQYALDQNLEAGTYNIVGNCTNPPSNTIEELVTFTMEIQKNNTGYFVTYYDEDGTILGQAKHYDPDALSMLDSEYVYVGFFAARNARIRVNDYTLTTILPADDKPAETLPVTYITPSISVSSSSTANQDSYTAYLYANVSGSATVAVNGTVAAENVAVTANNRCDVSGLPLKEGTNTIEVTLTPDPDQDLGEYTELSSTDPVYVSHTVDYVTTWAKQSNLYVSPSGTSTAAGTRKAPLDIYTAIQYVQPGQKIILMEGTYALTRSLHMEHGIDGTKDDYIYMIADPKSASRPVLDFQGVCAGIVHGGDYWYFQGFDVTNSKNGEKGIQVSGHYNVLDQVNTYRNGNTGIQISRYSAVDPHDEWPSHNLILNCTSHNNADAGYEDADGFACKLTAGEGNVFDGCVAYHNADDGWDLYAKVETGPIGSVIIRNCVAYENGYIEGETGPLINAGNGNGFKMGGESLSGKHTLINSYTFFNKAKGIDSNSCPDIIVDRATTYNNQTHNVAFYTNNAANTNFVANGILSFKDSTVASGYTTDENLKPVGTQDTSLYLNDTCYYWMNATSTNTEGATITEDVFESLTFRGILRNADGTIDMQGFLQLKDGAAEGIGAQQAGTASGVIDIVLENSTNSGDVDEDDEGSGTQQTGTASGVIDGVLENSTDFDDVNEDDWFYDAVGFVSARGLFNGTGNGKFSPVASMTRGMVVTVLHQMKGKPQPASSSSFVDIPENCYYAAAAQWALESNIVSGIGDNSFYGSGEITREQLILMLYNIAGKPDVTDARIDAPDSDDIHDWAVDAMQWAMKNGLLSGYEDGSVRPHGSATRAEVAQIMMKFVTLP